MVGELCVCVPSCNRGENAVRCFVEKQRRTARPRPRTKLLVLVQVQVLLPVLLLLGDEVLCRVTRRS